MMAYYGLKELFGDQMPIRGEIEVSFGADEKEGVTGVIANVFTQITGATKISGFKGLEGKFARHHLMNFDAQLQTNVKLTNKKNNQSVEVSYDPSSITVDPRQKELMAKILISDVHEDEKELFKTIWQKRVYEILKHPEDVIKVIASY